MVDMLIHKSNNYQNWKGICDNLAYVEENLHFEVY